MFDTNETLQVHHLTIANPLDFCHVPFELDSTDMTVIITSPLPTDTEAILDLLKVRARISDRLSQNADFQALQKLDATIHDLRSVIASAVKEAVDATAKAYPPGEKKGPLADHSQGDGSWEVLRHFKRPMPTGEIVEKLAHYGLVVGGKDKSINLSSTLSKDPRFRSIRYGGRACWWLADEDVPQDETAGTRPAA